MNNRPQFYPGLITERGADAWLQPRRGKAGAAEFFGLIGSVLAVKDFRVLSLMDGGDTIAAEFEIDCDVVPTGGHYRDEEIHLWTFNADGKVSRLRHYADTAKHIRAAGGARAGASCLLKAWLRLPGARALQFQDHDRPARPAFAPGKA